MQLLQLKEKISNYMYQVQYEKQLTLEVISGEKLSNHHRP